jgi:ketosteroid isomerase-like protein
MSQESVEIVRRVLEPYAMGSRARRSEFEDLLDPAIRLDLSERVFNPAVYEGYEGILRWQAEIGEVWESYRSEAEEFLDGGDVVLVFTHEYGRGKGSGVDVEQRLALLCTLRAGRVSEIRLYRDRERALSAAGLAE